MRQLSAGPADQRRRAAGPKRSPLRGAAHAAGQDPVRHDRGARASGEERAYLIDCTAAQTADLAKRLGFYKLRAKVAIADKSASAQSRPSGATSRRTSMKAFSTPTRAIRALAGARSAAPDAAAIGSEHVGEYEGLRIAVGAPKGGLDFAYSGRLPARRQFRSSPWGRFRQGLLCRPGGRLAHEASRNRPQARRARQTGRPGAGAGTPVMDGELAVGALGSSSKKDEKHLRCCESTALKRRARRGGR